MEKFLATNNVLLIKDSVGHAKPVTFKLPNSNFTYGKPDDKK